MLTLAHRRRMMAEISSMPAPSKQEEMPERPKARVAMFHDGRSYVRTRNR